MKHVVIKYALGYINIPVPNKIIYSKIILRQFKKGLNHRNCNSVNITI